MPVKVTKGKGAKPYKIQEVATGKTIATSRTRKDADASARIRNEAAEKKQKK